MSGGMPIVANPAAPYGADIRLHRGGWAATLAGSRRGDEKERQLQYGGRRVDRRVVQLTQALEEKGAKGESELSEESRSVG